MKPYVFSSSEVDGNGYQSITVCLKEPDVNENGLYQFGMLVHYCKRYVLSYRPLTGAVFFCPNFLPFNMHDLNTILNGD